MRTLAVSLIGNRLRNSAIHQRDFTRQKHPCLLVVSLQYVLYVLKIKHTDLKLVLFATGQTMIVVCILNYEE